MKYGPLVIETIFERIFEKWPNKFGESSAKKAFDVAAKSGEDLLAIEKACEIYLLDNLNLDPDFVYKLGNFIREDHWKDYLTEKKILIKRDQALALIEAWNNTCKKHWLVCTSAEHQLVFAFKALGDRAFVDHWQKALKKAESIFRYPIRETDLKKNIILSFRWFTNISPQKHTVLRLIEGEYGSGVKEERVKNIIGQPINYDERQKMAEELKSMFPSLKFEKKVDPPKELVINEATKKLVDEMMVGKLINTNETINSPANPEEIERSSDQTDDPIFS